MGVKILDVTTIHGEPLGNWWQLGLLGILISSAAIGSFVVIWQLIASLRARSKAKIEDVGVPSRIQSRLQKHIKQNIFPIHGAPRRLEKPTSFTAYTGELPAYEDEETTEKRYFDKHDLVILDPRQYGVLETLSRPWNKFPQHIVARIHIGEMVKVESLGKEATAVRAVEIMLKNIEGDLLQIEGQGSPFTGILLAGWQGTLSPAILSALGEYLSKLGFNVYLEVVPPHFMDQIARPDLSEFSGVVVRNGTVLPNGEVRDFFQMDKMKSTTKEFVSQSCLRPFTVMIWDSVDDRVELSHAVVRRSYQWCNYHGSLLWVGHESALRKINANNSIEEPLAAFQWLKEQDVMKIHDGHRKNRLLTSKYYPTVEAFQSLEDMLPSIRHILNNWNADDTTSSSASTLTLMSSDPDSRTHSPTGSSTLMDPRTGLEWSAGIGKSVVDPLSESTLGTNYTGLGCFPVGLQVTEEAFDEIVRSQRRLRKLKLLNQLSSPKVRQLGVTIQDYLNRTTINQSSPTIRALYEFVDLLGKASDLDQLSDPVQILFGIDSGFHGSHGAQFWSTYEIDRRTGALIIYVSKNAKDVTSTIMHAYLSSRGISRYHCMLTDYDHAQTKAKLSPQKLTARLEQDLDLLCSTDLLLFVQQFKFAHWDQGCPLLTTLRSVCTEMLLDVPTFEQLKELGNADYLDDSISTEDLVHSRINWYRQHGFNRLSFEAAQDIFIEVHYAFRDILHDKLYNNLNTITKALEMMIIDENTKEPRKHLDPFTDIVVFSIFCSARKAAFEEVYVEVSDRNPLFNEFSDQGAAFAELFALGSRCESYFDLTPSAFGKLLSNRHRAYYSLPENQPPMWIHNAPAFASAYASAQTDIDPEQKASTMPGYRRFTFLSVFAIPALVDILLLTTTGRGLYLSAFMLKEEQIYATLALMISLLLSGAIGTWISLGGTYYMISMAFSAANMFILTRLIGGLAITVLAATIGGAIIIGIKSWQAGLIFFFYLIGLTAYLSVLAAISSYQFPGSSFNNGRIVIICLMPTLLASPIVTMFVHNHDSKIYLTILYIFIILLFVGLRWVGSWWVTWTSHIESVDDAQVKEWYVENRADGKREVFDGMTDAATMALSRKALADAVDDARQSWRTPTDPTVKKLAKSWDATIFLLDWYCRITDVKRPMPFSSTWNIEVRVALDSLMQNQRGIRLHNAFIHWRTAGVEIGTGILFFIVALLDRWVGLFFGEQLVGLSDMENAALRVAVGFGLSYYLIGAVLLDYKAQFLHQKAEELAPITLQSTEFIRAAEMHDAKVRRKLYFRTLFKFLGVHVWALAVSAALVWVFDGNRTTFITFVSYVGAYTGLLLYQYNKIFSGPKAIAPLLTAVLIGLPVGIILKHYNQRTDVGQNLVPSASGVLNTIGDRHFAYSDVLSLAIATWTAAIVSFFTAKISLPKKIPLRDAKSHSHYHAYRGLGVDQQWSQSELESFYQGIITATNRSRFVINPNNHPGSEIKALLLSCNEKNLSGIALDSFPAIREQIHRLITAWDRGNITVELVSMRSVVPVQADLRALTYFSGGRLHILVEPDSEESPDSDTSIASNCKVIAETLIHAALEHFSGVSHEHSIIAESLLVCRFVNEEMTRVPERLRRSMPNPLSPGKKHSFLMATQRELLKYLCYGLPCDTNWEAMPLEIRRLILARVLGEAYPMTDGQLLWLSEHLTGENGCQIESRVARFNLGAILAVHKLNYFRKQVPANEDDKAVETAEDFQWLNEARNISTKRNNTIVFLETILTPFRAVYHSFTKWLKFFVIAAIADPEYQRELNCILDQSNVVVRVPMRYIYAALWIFARRVQSALIPWFVFKDRPELKNLWKSLDGTHITLKPGRVHIDSFDDKITAFIRNGADGTMKLFFYKGSHQKEPQNSLVLHVNTYSKDLKLTAREDFDKGNSVAEYVYDYPIKKEGKGSGRLAKFENTRVPVSRVCIRGDNQSARNQYNHKGFIESGSYMKNGNLVRFNYHYRKHAKYEDELLRAEYVLPYLSCNVSWAAPPVRHPEKPERWIPHSRVQEATFVQGSDVYESIWVYNHQYHPVIITTLNGFQVETPEMIRHDWLGLLKKPTNCSFLSDNPLLTFPGLHTSLVSRMLGVNKKIMPAKTSMKRNQLWKTWKKRNDIDGVVVRYLDESLLRNDTLLKPYWRKRDRGSLMKAEDYLALHADTIMASAELDNGISSWTPLAVRLSDLFSFGQGGDAVVYTRTKTLQPDTEDTLHVIAVDTGTWPNEGGGVSACRRDLINNLRTIRWNMLVESANDYGLPKHQTQENVESLKIIPLWGLDFMHPVHGMFFNKLDSEVDTQIKTASREDIKRNFIPTLTALVKGARAINLSDADVKQCTRALVNLNTYFEDSRHWKEVWESKTVKDAWRQLWLADDLPNTKPPSEWFDTERPTLGHLDSALDLWFRYLFIFSIPMPEKVPSVFQASHHSVSAAYGIVCKIKRNCALQIWDHAISWRETNLYLSSALCTLPPFIRNSLLGLMRLTSMLTLHHADFILPCADFFNPGWEVEIGTSQGMIEHRNVFKRKIDPVVNGITDMQKFAPVKEITTKKPTVTMLSHVWFAKDIKTALLAADIIVNKWGFSEYCLDIYGALNKAPIYSSECQEIIATKGLAPNVSLKGTADPAAVLSATWLFLNSSVSEGLPLALGEAALTGAPVVCTDVGASLRVLTHPESNERFSEIVAPNDALSLARAQINMLAMIGQWAKYTDDTPDTPAPILPVDPTPRDVQIITQRMYDKTVFRRKLGMKARDIVQTSFSGERYLREHEQMLWVGKARWEAQGGYGNGQVAELLPTEFTVAASEVASGTSTPKRRYSEVVDAQTNKMAHPKLPWLSSGKRKSGSSSRSSFTSVGTESYDENRFSGISSAPMRHPASTYGVSRMSAGEEQSLRDSQVLRVPSKPLSGRFSFQSASPQAGIGPASAGPSQPERPVPVSRKSFVPGQQYKRSTLSEVHVA